MAGMSTMRTLAPVLALFLCLGADAPAPRPVGDFENHADVGAVSPPGSASYDPAKKEYRVTAAGENIWGKADAFHFVFSKVNANELTLSADVRFEGAGKNAHRKACLMVRGGLDADDPYADVAVHGDGLISLQFRKEKGGVTEEVQSKVKAPATVRLRRKGAAFTLEVAAPGKPFEVVGGANVPLPGAAYAGLAVASHEAAVSETAVFSNLGLTK
jgi:hypothetical protein